MKSHLILNKGRETVICYILIVLILTLGFVHGETYSSSLSSCVTYENLSSYKWCRSLTTNSFGYICSSSEYTTNWGYSTSSSRWSSESSNLPQHAKYFLCPTNSIWNTQSSSLNYQNDYVTLSPNSSFLDTNYICWYRITVQSSNINKVMITISSLSYATAEVYYESSSSASIYSYMGSVSNGGSMNVSASYYGSVWVLIIPTSSSADASIYAKGLYSSTSSSTTIYGDSTTTKVPLLTLFMILILFTGGFLIVWLITWLCLCIWTWTKGNKPPIAQIQYNGPMQGQHFVR